MATYQSNQPPAYVPPSNTYGTVQQPQYVQPPGYSSTYPSAPLPDPQTAYPSAPNYNANYNPTAYVSTQPGRSYPAYGQPQTYAPYASPSQPQQPYNTSPYGSQTFQPQQYAGGYNYPASDRQPLKPTVGSATHSQTVVVTEHCHHHGHEDRSGRDLCCCGLGACLCCCCADDCSNCAEAILCLPCNILNSFFSCLCCCCD